jgi:hypothetical protein
MSKKIDVDVEETIKSFAERMLRVAVIYDEASGWCVTDQVLQDDHGYSVRTPKQWFCKTLPDALAMLGRIHVLRAHEEAKIRR